MIHWCEISKQADKTRNDIVRDFLVEKGIQNQLDYIQCEPEELKAKILEAQGKYQFIRIHPDYGIQVIEQFEGITSEMLNMGAADCFLKSKGSWWPRTTLFSAFGEIIAKDASRLNLNSEVLIVGAGSVAKVMVNGFVKLGFKKINISSLDDELSKSFVQATQRHLFDVELTPVPHAKLVTLPGVHGVMVSTIPFGDNQDLLEDLCYFNFLEKNGLVIDMNLVPIESRLLREAHTVGAWTIAGHEFIAATDALWAKEISKLDNLRDEYLDFILKKLQPSEPKN